MFFFLLLTPSCELLSYKEIISMCIIQQLCHIVLPSINVTRGNWKPLGVGMGEGVFL